MTVLATINNLEITGDTQVYRIAAAIPGAAAVFTRNRMDWCCKGLMSLDAHCAEADVDVVAFLDEVAEAATEAPSGPDWTKATTPELVERILHFHEAHRRDLPELSSLIASLATVLGRRRPALIEMAAVFPTFAQETYDHLEREEAELFPAIERGDTTALAPLLLRLREEHEGHDHRLAAFRDWCEDFRTVRAYPPVPNDPTQQLNTLHLRLEGFEADLMEHMHLENNLLFPRL